MATLLIINSSPRSNSVSRRLTRHAVEQWKQRNPGGRIIERDLTTDTPPYLTDAWIQAVQTPADQRTPEQKEVLAVSDELIDELVAADVIVLGVPMHNFTVSAPLKAWIDQIVRAGKTFSYSDKGPQGLLPSGKKVWVIVSRGGVYDNGAPADFQVPYLRHMLGFVGLTDVTVIDANQQAFGAEAAQKSIDKAIEKLTAETERYSSSFAVSA